MTSLELWRNKEADAQFVQANAGKGFLLRQGIELNLHKLPPQIRAFQTWSPGTDILPFA